MNSLLGDTFPRENNTHRSRFHDRDPQFASRIWGAMTQSCYIGTRDIWSRVIRGPYCTRISQSIITNITMSPSIHIHFEIRVLSVSYLMELSTSPYPVLHKHPSMLVAVPAAAVGAAVGCVLAAPAAGVTWHGPWWRCPAPAAAGWRHQPGTGDGSWWRAGEEIYWWLSARLQ